MEELTYSINRTAKAKASWKHGTSVHSAMTAWGYSTTGFGLRPRLRGCIDWFFDGATAAAEKLSLFNVMKFRSSF